MLKNLSRIPYGQCKVYIDDNGNSYLISYTTTVAGIVDGWLSISGLYSATTRKHIGAYVAEYANISYQVAKKLYEDDYKYNIYTGEVEKI